ncbi:MAG: ATP-grasp domain-containing protein [Patescibacteria group bacterium]
MKRILVTGAGGPAGINALKLLSALPEGAEVFGTDIDPMAAGQFFCKEFALSARCDNPEAYKASMLELIQRWHIDTILPTVSEELVMIREALQGVDIAIVLSAQETIERCHDKREFYRFVTAEAPALMGKWATADKVDWEAETYFLKPAFGRGSRGCRLITASELALIAKQPDAASWIVMEPLPGKEWTVDAYIDAAGATAYVVPRERLQMSGGISSKGKTVHETEVMKRTEALLALLPCHGPVCVQWKQDANGVPMLLEMNPRLSGAVTITALAGANPMACLLEDLAHGRVNPVEWRDIAVVRYFEDRIV